MAAPPAAPEKMTLDRSDGSATIDLYRAALGPQHTDYYLKAFTRFDAAGQSGPSWNWAAALLSLNWMLFRKLWTVALAYVGAVSAATLLLFGIGRLVFQLSPEAQWMLLLLATLLAIAVPGVYGNAWLYAACNQRMESALAASASLDEACALLTRHASGVKRMVSLAGLNALCLVVAAVALSWPAPGALPLHVGPVAQTQVTGLVQNAAETPQQSPAVVGSKSAASAPLSAASAVASAPQTTASLSPPPMLLVANAVPPGQGGAQRRNQDLIQAGAAAAAALAQPSPMVAASAPDPLPTAKKAKTAKPTKAEKLAKAKAARAADKEAAQAAIKTKVAKAAPANSTGPESGKYLINVGLFADANNARNATVKLQDAGLPTLSQEVKSSKGPRTRVRVGPFETQAEADRAAERIRALQLEAVVFKP
jgi:cell division septation protein DedD